MFKRTVDFTNGIRIIFRAHKFFCKRVLSTFSARYRFSLIDGHRLDERFPIFLCAADRISLEGKIPTSSR